MNKLKTKYVDEKLFVFGGTYSNLQATQAIFEKAKSLGFSNDQMVFTGDMIAYCGQPQETADFIRSSNITCIMGNCEESLANDRADCGCGFEEGSSCSTLSEEWYRFCQQSLSAETIAWMGDLPKQLLVSLYDMNFLVTHATPARINQFVFASDLEAMITQPEFATLEPDLAGYIVGHSGIPFIRTTGNKLWLNSGAAGMPANDGTARVWCASIIHKSGELIIETHAVEYEFQTTVKEISRAGLSDGYANALSTGIWPSMDVLPETERSQKGIPLSPQRKKLCMPTQTSVLKSA
ncbi:MAG: metallophosphoesterase family protein [Pseudomonadota bacterium]